MVALLDEIALVEEDFGQLAGDLGAHADRRVRFDVADTVDVDRHVALGHLRDDDRDRAAFAAAAARRRRRGAAARRQRQHEAKQAILDDRTIQHEWLQRVDDGMPRTGI